MWFSVDGCGTIEIHGTANGAKLAAEQSLQDERDLAVDGWSDDVGKIMWGKVHGYCKQTYCRPRTDDDNNTSFDEIADYHIEEIEGAGQ